MDPRVFLLCFVISQGFLSVDCDDKASEQTGLYFTQEPKDVYAQKDEPLLIPCSAISARKRPLTWHWLHNGLPVVSDDRRQILSNGSLYFSTIKHKSRFSDQGEYRCIISDGDGFLSSMYIYLRVAGMPVFRQNPENQTARAGTHVRMSCQAESLPQAEITWERNGAPIPEWSDKYLMFTGPGFIGSVMYILNLESNDAGNYRCVAINPVRRIKRKSKEATLIVRPALMFVEPKFLTPSYQKNVVEGDLVVLDCVGSGRPPPTLFWTYRKNSYQPAVDVFNSSTNGQNIVYLENVKRNHSGLYICNFVTDSIQSIILDVKVSKGPEIVHRPQTVSYRAAKAVRFYCNATGDPVPMITWMKDGTHLNIGGRFGQNTKINQSLSMRMTELIVSSSLASDAGIYQCVAQNSVGVAWSAARLILNSIKQAPSPPEKVTCETLSSSEIRIDWDIKPEAILSGIQAFTIHYHDREGGEEYRDAIPPKNRSYTVRSLIPYTNYTFYLRSYSDAASDFSNQAICQTDEEPPRAAPEIELINSSSNSLQISWTPLTKQQARGEVVEYKIQWRLHGTPSIDVHRVNGDILNYTITDLKPNSAYEIRVLAATRKGLSALEFPWKLFNVPGPATSEQLPPAILRLQALNSTTVKAEWGVEGDVDTKFQGYKLFFKKEKFLSYYGPMFFKTNETEFYMTDLDPDTRYEVTVATFLGRNEGKRISSIVKTLLPGQSYETSNFDRTFAIETPTALKAEPVGRGIIRLSWNPPSSGNIPIIDYSICYNPVHSVPSRASLNCLRSRENKVSIANLEPYSLYEFRIRANGVDDTHSAYSRSVECYTIEDVPSQVVDVRWRVENKNTIYISWEKPKRTNGYIQNYTIYYSQNSSLPLSSWNSRVIPGGIYEARLFDVAPNTEYYMIIRAATSAGLGLYGKPKKMIIPVLVGLSKKSPKSEQDRKNEQFMGVILGLGIGVTCIIVCILYVLYRRRCTKNQEVEEIEPTSGRGPVKPSRRAESDVGKGSQETEFPSYVSKNKSRTENTSVEGSSDVKDRPNGISNGTQMTLLGEERSSKGSPYRESVQSKENPESDGSHFLSPLLASSSGSRDICADSDSINHFKVPLIPEKRNFTNSSEDLTKLNCELKESEREMITSTASNSNSAFVDLKSSDDSFSRDIKTVKDNNNKFGGRENRQMNELLNDNQILENPDFRFSDLVMTSNFPNKKENCFTPQTSQNCAGDPFL